MFKVCIIPKQIRLMHYSLQTFDGYRTQSNNLSTKYCIYFVQIGNIHNLDTFTWQFYILITPTTNQVDLDISLNPKDSPILVFTMDQVDYSQHLLSAVHQTKFKRYFNS